MNRNVIARGALDYLFAVFDDLTHSLSCMISFLLFRFLGLPVSYTIFIIIVGGIGLGTKADYGTWLGGLASLVNGGQNIAMALILFSLYILLWCLHGRYALHFGPFPSKHFSRATLVFIHGKPVWRIHSQ